MRSGKALPAIWRSLAVIAVVLVVGVLYTTRPTGWQSVLLYESGAFCTVLILVGVRVYRPRPAAPWMFLALGIGLSVAGDFVYDALPLLSLDYHGFGHLYDVLYLASYPAYVLAAFGFLGTQARRRDVTVLIDGVIYALAGWLVLWLLLVYPQLATGGLTIWDWAPTVLYPPLDVIALIVWWRVGRGDVRQSAPWRFTAGAFLLMFAADLAYALTAMPDGGALSDVLNVGWLMSYALFAAGAVHPLMRHLIAVPSSGAPQSEHVRVVGIGVALATPIALIALLPNDARHLMVMITIVALALVVIAIARFALTLARHRDAEATFAYGATHDPLTGLANRAELLVQLEAATRRSARRRDSCAVLFVDLDDFKIVNDSLGHSAGVTSSSWCSKASTVPSPPSRLRIGWPTCSTHRSSSATRSWRWRRASAWSSTRSARKVTSNRFCAMRTSRCTRPKGRPRDAPGSSNRTFANAPPIGSN